MRHHVTAEDLELEPNPGPIWQTDEYSTARGKQRVVNSEGMSGHQRRQDLRMEMWNEWRILYQMTFIS